MMDQCHNYEDKMLLICKDCNSGLQVDMLDQLYALIRIGHRHPVVKRDMYKTASEHVIVCHGIFTIEE